MENNEFKIDPSLLLDGTEKVGDTIWTIEGGYEPIVKITENDYFPIICSTNSYTKKGYDCEGNKTPSAFKRNPFVSQYPKLMEVSDDGKNWDEEPHEVLFTKNNLYWICYKAFNSEDWNILGYKFAREIQPKAPDFSEEQIKYLESKGINVEQLKIKK